MKKPSIQRLWSLLCTVLILSACQKETSTHEPQANENNLTFASGVVADDPALEAKVPVIMSSEFRNSTNALGAKGGGRGGKQTDSDGDGIPDSSDACPTQKETFNGYQDNDGCPDTAPPTTGGDATPPTVSISSPASGTTVSGTANVTVNAADNVGVSSVTLSVDGTVIGTRTTAPYSFSWNTTMIADGTHTLTARAYDAAGNSGSSSVSVTNKNTTVIPPSTSLPSSFQLATPTPAYQGGEGTCVAFAVGYAARAIEQYYKTGASSFSYATNIFSPEFLFNQIKTDAYCTSSSVLDALDFLSNKGICTWQSMPYSSNDCSLLPNSSQLSEALNYKIASYSRIYTNDLTAIKTALVNKHPLLITFAIDNSFYAAGPGFIWKSYSSTNGPRHCVAIVGYDDAKKAVKIINSWGTTWGDGGYTWIDYDFLPMIQSTVYAMNL